MQQATLGADAIDNIWHESALTSSEAADALGVRTGETLMRFRRHSWLLGLQRGRRYLYPAFQFDVRQRRLFPEVRSVNELLGAADDPRGVACWWVSSNARLGARPLDLIGTDRADHLVEAASAVIEPVG
jgi:hypothetical protein